MYITNLKFLGQFNFDSLAENIKTKFAQTTEAAANLVWSIAINDNNKGENTDNLIKIGILTNLNKINKIKK